MEPEDKKPANEEESKVISIKDTATALIEEYQGKMEEDKQALAQQNKAKNEIIAKYNKIIGDLSYSLISYDGAILGLQKLLEEKK